MSAFVGLIELASAPASDSTVGAMLERLRHRVDQHGWNARQIRTSGSVGLGYASLDSTPQAKFEREHPAQALSLAAPNGQPLWIVGDIRLDRREDLAQRLEKGEEAHEWSDSRLVLEAYARFGEETPRELKGDFAFAIWDEARGTLFCARDRFGVRPFYFAFVPGRVLAFANEIKALWPALPFSPRPDETHIVAYLSSDFTSYSRTFYEGVERLPPAQTLVLDMKHPESVRHSTYFTLQSEPELHLDSQEEYDSLLREHFEHSVRERTRSTDRLAVFLSGGLDSSSVAAVATRHTPEKHPLLAMSTVFARFKECDERPWIEENLALAGPALEREWMWADDIGALHDIERLVWHLDGPPIGPNTCSTWAQYTLLQKAGTRVVLDGHGGDEVVFLGYQRITELVRERRFKEARHELLLLRRHGVTNVSATPLLWARIAQKARGTRFIGRLMRLSSAKINAIKARNGRTAPPTEAEEGTNIMRGLVHPDKRALISSITPMPKYATVREHHESTLQGALQSLALESMDAIGGAHALEVRVPFWEEEIIALCLKFPSDQKLRDGWNRWVMRRAMQELLPPRVCWRRDKTNFAPHMIFGLRALEKARVEMWLNEPGPLKQWIDIQHARTLWTELQTLSPGSARAAYIAFGLWHLLVLGVWLQGFNDD